MSFLGLQAPRKDAGKSVPLPYDRLGYAKNPFPGRGVVDGSIYQERPEARELGQALHRFLTSPDVKGGLWMVEADAGIGKSNFLSNIHHEITAAGLTGVASHYLQSQPVSTRQLIEHMVQLLGQDALKDLLGRGKDIPSLPEHVLGTELSRFMDSIRLHLQGQRADEDTGFLLRWLSGAQTTVAERARYNIWSRDKLVPAVALPYLHILFELLRVTGLRSKLILLLDEFEDVLTLSRAAQNEYVTVLKGLFNLFNGDGLFIVLSGQPQAVLSIGARAPSLAARWQKVVLEPLFRSEDAVRLAHAYMKAAHQEHQRSQPGQPLEKRPELLSPTLDEIKSEFVTLSEKSPTGRVLQRDLLAALHERIDRMLTSPPAER
jgi:hypothetical protein